MADYNFDIAFDWNALGDPDNGGNPLLAIGLATFNQPVQRGTQYTFHLGQDSFCFNGYDQTPGATVGAHSISGGSVTFRPAVTQTASSPINQASLSIGQPASSGMTPSDVFPGADYPSFCPVLPLQLVTEEGDFFFTVSLNVTSDGITKTFSVDPEMIVEGPTG